MLCEFFDKLESFLHNHVTCTYTCTKKKLNFEVLYIDVQVLVYVLLECV